MPADEFLDDGENAYRKSAQNDLRQVFSRLFSNASKNLIRFKKWYLAVSISTVRKRFQQQVKNADGCA